MSKVGPGLIVTRGENEYHIGEKIGSGGFGVVYRAERVKPLRRSVIVKVPQDHVLTDPKASKKFEREARILANVSHANVVRILAFWKFDDGEMAIVQEEVAGAMPIHRYVPDHLEETASLFLQALYGLRAFHQGASPAVVHRDISPRNLLVDDSGSLKIIDFGLAKEDPRATQMLTSIGMQAGTSGCIAPEQTRNFADVDHRADLYALGRSFAAALQDRDPQHVEPRELDDPWRTLCSTLTEYRPESRYSDADYAIGEAMRMFADNFTPIHHFERHVSEMRPKNGRTFPSAWPRLCEQHFRSTTIEESELRMLARLGDAVFAAEDFQTLSFFDELESADTIETIASGVSAYESADPLGTVYAKIFPNLDRGRKEACLKRLVRAAVNQHRYDTMGFVRRVFAKESDPSFRDGRMVEILDEHDPEKVIHGRGVIPDREP